MVIVLRGRRLLFGFVVACIMVWVVARVGAPLVVEVSARLTDRLAPIYKVDRDDRRVAISFDATWGADQTDEILDILDRHDVKTTFFLAGYWVEKYPEYVKMIAARGHEIGNHSYEHPHMNALTEEQIRRDLKKNHDLLKELTSEDSFVFRPPFGEYSDKVLTVAGELGYFTIQWSIDSLDWKDVSADFMVNRVMQKIGPGDIVLFHNAGKHTPKAVDVLLPRLKAEGYEVVPISEVIYLENYLIESHSGVQKRKAQPKLDVPEETAPSPQGEGDGSETTGEVPTS